MGCRVGMGVLPFLGLHDGYLLFSDATSWNSVTLLATCPLGKPA